MIPKINLKSTITKEKIKQNENNYAKSVLIKSKNDPFLRQSTHVNEVNVFNLGDRSDLSEENKSERPINKKSQFNRGISATTNLSGNVEIKQKPEAKPVNNNKNVVEVKGESPNKSPNKQLKFENGTNLVKKESQLQNPPQAQTSPKKEVAKSARDSPKKDRKDNAENSNLDITASLTVKDSQIKESKKHSSIKHNVKVDTEISLDKLPIKKSNTKITPPINLAVRKENI